MARQRHVRVRGLRQVQRLDDYMHSHGNITTRTTRHSREGGNPALLRSSISDKSKTCKSA